MLEYNGKAAKEWNELIVDGNMEQRDSAFTALSALIFNGTRLTPKDMYAIGKNAAKLTYSSCGITRLRAYGLCGICLRHFAFYLHRGTKRQRMQANKAIARMIRESNVLHADAVRLSPEIVEYYRNTTRRSIQALRRVRDIVRALERTIKASEGQSLRNAKVALARTMNMIGRSQLAA